MLKSTLFKWIVVIGSVSVLAAGFAGAAFLLFPVAPLINAHPNPSVSQAPLETCGIYIAILDQSTNEDDFRVYRRNAGTSAFTLIQILPPKPGRKKPNDKDALFYATDSPLPPGVYEYKVSAYNAYGESFSSISSAQVTGADCVNVPVVNMAGRPANPLIVNLSLVNNCSVRIDYRDNSTNEQGFRIHRAKQYEGLSSFEPESLVATLGPHNGISGVYNDLTKLTEGNYRYRMSAYNASGSSFSNFAEIKIDQVCNPTMQFFPTKIPPTLAATLQKLSTESCTWEAAANVFLRKGPDVGLFDRLIDKQAGQTLPIIGQSEDGTFWAVEVSPGLTGYITKSEKYSRISGNCEDIPTLTDPAPPEIPDPAAPKKPGDGGSSTPECSDGIDNDGDGLTDYNPFGSGDPSCSSADGTSE